MPVIHINCKAGKTDDQKRKAYAAITEACVTHLDCPREVVEIFWHEITDNNFARGGEMLLDIEQREGS